MRTIKFRTYSLITKEMSFPDSIDLPWEQKRDGIYLMQFTGLLDKNGKEIYEGDIIERKWTNNISGEYEHNRAVGEVKFGEAETDSTPVMGFYFYDKGWGCFYMTDVTPVEVIGNIYENPQILEDKE